MQQFNNEIVIVRAKVTTTAKVVLPGRYHRLFQAKTLPIGLTIIRFPVNDHELSTDLTRFQEEFPFIDVDISSNAIEEY